MSHHFVLGDIARSTIVVSEGNQVALLNHHWLLGVASGLGATDGDLASDLDALIAPLIKPVLANGATYNGMLVQKILPLPITRRAVAVTNAGIGTAGATSVPKQCAALITWYTELTGRAQRGRTYWPFAATAMQNTAGELAGGTVTNYIALGNALLTFGSTGGGTDHNPIALGIFHRGAGSIDIISTFVQNHLFATQKRRGSYGRPNVSPI